MSTPIGETKFARTTDVLAPRWHTAILVAWMLVVATLGAILSLRHAEIVAPPPGAAKIVAAYLPTILVEWLLFFFACRVARRRGVLAFLMGREWSARTRWPVDAACALALIVIISGSEAFSAYLLHISVNPAVLALMPHTLVEHLVWVGVSLSAAFCEEVVYRGYLRTQLAAFARSPFAGVAIQAVLFGLAHAEQGAFTAMRFALYGVAFGVVAQSRQSLLPGIVAHLTIDLTAGFVPR